MRWSTAGKSQFAVCHITVIDLSAEIATLQTAVVNTRQQLKSMKNKPVLQKEASAAQPDGASD